MYIQYDIFTVIARLDQPSILYVHLGMLGDTQEMLRYMNFEYAHRKTAEIGCACTCQRADGRKPNCTPVCTIPFISEAC